MRTALLNGKYFARGPGQSHWPPFRIPWTFCSFCFEVVTSAALTDESAQMRWAKRIRCSVITYGTVLALSREPPNDRDGPPPGAQLAIAPLPRIANYPRTRGLQLTFPPGAQPARALRNPLPRPRRLRLQHQKRARHQRRPHQRSR